MRIAETAKRALSVPLAENAEVTAEAAKWTLDDSLAEGAKLLSPRSLRIYRQSWILRSQRLQGQSTLEYAIFVSVVAAALIGMQTYLRRSIQANLKVMEDRINAEAGLPPPGSPPPIP